MNFNAVSGICNAFHKGITQNYTILSMDEY